MTVSSREGAHARKGHLPPRGEGSSILNFRRLSRPGLGGGEGARQRGGAVFIRGTHGSGRNRGFPRESQLPEFFKKKEDLSWTKGTRRYLRTCSIGEKAFRRNTTASSSTGGGSQGGEENETSPSV